MCMISMHHPPTSPIIPWHVVLLSYMYGVGCVGWQVCPTNTVLSPTYNDCWHLLRVGSRRNLNTHLNVGISPCLGILRF